MEPPCSSTTVAQKPFPHFMFLKVAEEICNLFVDPNVEKRRIIIKQGKSK